MIRCVVNFFVFFQASSFWFRFLLTVNKYHLCFDLWNNLPFLRRISRNPIKLKEIITRPAPMSPPNLLEYATNTLLRNTCWYLATMIHCSASVCFSIRYNGNNFFRFRLVLCRQVPALSGFGFTLENSVNLMAKHVFSLLTNTSTF